jgi:cysteine-rich repeat protein
VTVRLARCPGVRRLAITATLTADCDAMEGTLRRAAPRRTHRFDARRTRCGDGRTDAARGEACDGSGCPAGEPCTPDCTCGPAVLPPSPTSTTSTSAPTTSSTTSSTRPPAVCGNGRREPGERCDGSDSGNGRCPEGGPLGCTADCLRYDFSTCFRCGNGLREGDEQCDGRDLGGAVCDRPGDTGGAVTCRYDCRLDHRTCWRCGNGRVDGDEACDDGNTTAGDGCSPTCMLE